jgi:hypothetical protein
MRRQVANAGHALEDQGKQQQQRLQQQQVAACLFACCFALTAGISLLENFRSRISLLKAGTWL